MATSPAKLKALVDQQAQNPGMAALLGPRNAPASDDDGDDDEDDAPAVPPVDPLARGNELIASWGERGAALKEDAGEIVDGAHEVGGDLLVTPVPEDAIDETEKNFDGMPDEIQQCLAKYVAVLPPEDVAALAAALTSGHDGDTDPGDPKLVAAYLTQLATYAKDEVDPKDLEDEEDDEDDDEDDDAAPDAAPPVAPPVAGTPLPPSPAV